MPVYEFTGRRLRRPDGDDITRGDTYEAPEDDPVVQGFSDLFRETDESSADYSADDERVDSYDLDEDDDEPTEPQGGGEPAAESDEVDDLLAGTVDEVREELDSGEYDDSLDDIEEQAERQGVLDAVEERRD